MSQLAIDLRPRKIQDVYGQESVVNEVGKMLKSKDWPTAMLMKGSTGTGKSTVAYIVAAAINCSSPLEDGNPCGVCASCKSIMEERFGRDTIRLNANENGGKSDILDLNAYADVAPMYDPKKVIIIEEADSLSTAAKSALLKLLENPKKNIHYILLSMVNGGIPAPIKSRCQTYSFKSFGAKDIMLALKGILEALNLWEGEALPKSFKFEGLASLATSSGGSLREAVQNLQKCLTGEYYTREAILDNLGVMDSGTLNEALTALLDKKPNVFYQQIENLNIPDFFNLAYSIVTDALIYKMTNYCKSDFYEESNKVLSKHPKLRQVVALFEEISKEAQPYLRKAYFLSKTADWFLGHSGMNSVSVEERMRGAPETRPFVPTRPTRPAGEL